MNYNIRVFGQIVFNGKMLLKQFIYRLKLKRVCYNSFQYRIFKIIQNPITMKKIIIATVFSFQLFFSYAQKIKVDEGTERIGSGSNNAFTTIVYECSVEQVIKEWKSRVKDFGGKTIVNENELFTDNAVIKSFGSNNTVDIYARVERIKDNETKLIVAYDLGGAYLSSAAHKDKVGEAKEILREFAVKTTKESIEDLLKVQQKTLKKLNNEQDDLVKQNEKLNKTIETSKQEIIELQEKIKKAEADIVINKKDQELKKSEVGAQQKVVDGINAKLSSVN